MYLDHVKVLIDGATADALAAAAFELERLTKLKILANGQVDTRFMLNSVYTVTRQGGSYGEAAAAAQSANPEARMGPQATLTGDAGAAVVVGAGYAIYQEVRQSFLYASAEVLAGQVGGKLEAVYREAVRD